MQLFLMKMPMPTSTHSPSSRSLPASRPACPCRRRSSAPQTRAVLVLLLAILTATCVLRVEALPRAQIDLGQIPSMLPTTLPAALPTALPPGLISPRPATVTPTQTLQQQPALPTATTSVVAPESAMAPTSTPGSQNGSSASSTNASDSSMSVGAVVGIAAVILIIIGAAGIAWIRRAKRLALQEQQRRGSGSDPNKALLALSSVPPASRTTGDAPTVTVTLPNSPLPLPAPAATPPNFLVSRLPSAPSISSNEEVSVPAIIVPPSPGITPSHASTLPLGPTISPPPSSMPTNSTYTSDTPVNTNTITNTVSADRATTASFPTLTPLPFVFRPDGTCGPLVDDRDFPITENTLASVRKGFLARATDEVALSPGDTVTIHSRFPDMWARGTRHPNGPSGPDAVTGFFPLGALDMGRTDTLLTQRSASLSRNSAKAGAGESMSRAPAEAGSPPSNLSTSMTRDQVSGEVDKVVASSS